MCTLSKAADFLVPQILASNPCISACCISTIAYTACVLLDPSMHLWEYHTPVVSDGKKDTKIWHLRYPYILVDVTHGLWRKVEENSRNLTYEISVPAKTHILEDITHLYLAPLIHPADQTLTNSSHWHLHVDAFRCLWCPANISENQSEEKLSTVCVKSMGLWS